MGIWKKVVVDYL